MSGERASLRGRVMADANSKRTPSEPKTWSSGAALAREQELREALREAWERIAAGDSDGAAELIEAALDLSPQPEGKDG